MSNTWKIIVTVAILLLIATSIFIVLYDKSSELDTNSSDKSIENLTIEIQELRKSNDSLLFILKDEKIKYDSISRNIDSLKVRYNSIGSRYNKIRDSIKYLNADESIIFLKEEAGL